MSTTVKPLNVLIACEYSGIVRDAFLSRGHNAISLDIIPSDVPGPHIVSKFEDYYIPGTWDLIIAFPPCTFLCRASQSWNKKRPERLLEREKAISFVRYIMSLDCDKICVENPIGVLSSFVRPPDQIIYPFQFGDPYRKDICLWLKGLSPLVHTKLSPGRKSMSNHVNSRMSQDLKSKIKSRFFPGIAEAMANQWGS